MPPARASARATAAAPCARTAAAAAAAAGENNNNNNTAAAAAATTSSSSSSRARRPRRRPPTAVGDRALLASHPRVLAALTPREIELLRDFDVADATPQLHNAPPTVTATEAALLSALAACVESPAPVLADADTATAAAALRLWAGLRTGFDESYASAADKERWSLASKRLLPSDGDEPFDARISARAMSACRRALEAVGPRAALEAAANRAARSGSGNGSNGSSNGSDTPTTAAPTLIPPTPTTTRYTAYGISHALVHLASGVAFADGVGLVRGADRHRRLVGTLQPASLRRAAGEQARLVLALLRTPWSPLSAPMPASHAASVLAAKTGVGGGFGLTAPIDPRRVPEMLTAHEQRCMLFLAATQTISFAGHMADEGVLVLSLEPSPNALLPSSASNSGDGDGDGVVVVAPAPAPAPAFDPAPTHAADDAHSSSSSTTNKNNKNEDVGGGCGNGNGSSVSTTTTISGGNSYGCGDDDADDPDGEAAILGVAQVMAAAALAVTVPCHTSVADPVAVSFAVLGAAEAAPPDLPTRRAAAAIAQTLRMTHGCQHGIHEPILMRGLPSTLVRSLGASASNALLATVRRAVAASASPRAAAALLVPPQLALPITVLKHIFLWEPFNDETVAPRAYKGADRLAEHLGFQELRRNTGLAAGHAAALMFALADAAAEDEDDAAQAEPAEAAAVTSSSGGGSNNNGRSEGGDTGAAADNTGAAADASAAAAAKKGAPRGALPPRPADPLSEGFRADTAIVVAAAALREHEYAGLGTALDRDLAPALTYDERVALHTAAASVGDRRDVWARLDARLTRALLASAAGGAGGGGGGDRTDDAGGERGGEAADALVRDLRRTRSLSGLFGDALARHELALPLARLSSALALPFFGPRSDPASARPSAPATTWEAAADPDTARRSANVAMCGSEAAAAVTRSLALHAPCATHELLAGAVHLSWTHSLLDPRLDCVLAARALEQAAPCVPLLERALSRARREGGAAGSSKADEVERRAGPLIRTVAAVRAATATAVEAGRAVPLPILTLRRVEHAVTMLGDAGDVGALARLAAAPAAPAAPAAAASGPSPAAAAAAEGVDADAAAADDDSEQPQQQRRRRQRCSFGACESNWLPQGATAGAACGGGEGAARKALHRCARCVHAAYCGKACQRSAWDRHKLLCGLIAHERQQKEQQQQK